MKRAFAVAALLAAAAPASAQRGPAPASSHLPAQVLALACAPNIVSLPPDTPLRITGAQETVQRRTFAPGDLVTINAGVQNGIEIGQQYYIRRVFGGDTNAITVKKPAAIRTAGWLKIYAVD